MRNFSLRLSDEMISQIGGLANREGLKPAQVVRTIIRRALDGPYRQPWTSDLVRRNPACVGLVEDVVDVRSTQEVRP